MAAIPSPRLVPVSHVEDMKLPGRLVLAALGAVVLSVGLAACYEHTLMQVTEGEFRGMSGETTARIHEEVIVDAEQDAVRFGRVLVPLAVTVLWWREKWKGRAV